MIHRVYALEELELDIIESVQRVLLVENANPKRDPMSCVIERLQAVQPRAVYFIRRRLVHSPTDTCRDGGRCWWYYLCLVDDIAIKVLVVRIEPQVPYKIANVLARLDFDT